MLSCCAQPIFPPKIESDGFLNTRCWFEVNSLYKEHDLLFDIMRKK